MLFMVVERFKNGDFAAVGERFRSKGRMLPEDVVYHASWVDPAGARCFQIMEAPRPESLRSWTEAWSDLVEFDIVRVQTSSEFWSRY